MLPPCNPVKNVENKRQSSVSIAHIESRLINSSLDDFPNLAKLKNSVDKDYVLID